MNKRYSVNVQVSQVRGNGFSISIVRTDGWFAGNLSRMAVTYHASLPKRTAKSG